MAKVEDPPKVGAKDGATSNGNGTHAEVGGDDAQQGARLIGIEGTGQLSFAVGGKKPDTSKVQLVGRSIELPEGQLEKGAEYTVMMRVRVGSVHFDDKIDPSTEQVTGSTRKHKCRIVGDVRVVPDSALDAQG